MPRQTKQNHNADKIRIRSVPVSGFAAKPPAGELITGFDLSPLPLARLLCRLFSCSGRSLWHPLRAAAACRHAIGRDDSAPSNASEPSFYGMGKRPPPWAAISPANSHLSGRAARRRDIVLYCAGQGQECQCPTEPVKLVGLRHARCAVRGSSPGSCRAAFDGTCRSWRPGGVGTKGVPC